MPLKICLAGSGGGHVRQLLDLEPAWRGRDIFFVTEPTALGDSLAATYDVEFVAHYSFGQARLGKPVKMVRDAWRNFTETRAMMAHHKPQVVVTTGAGAMFLPALFAKWRGAKLIAIESFARFDRPSLFGRMIAPFADVQIIQSKSLATIYPKALVFDPFRKLDGPRPAKERLILATVGATLPFPRLSEAVVALKREKRVDDRVVLQTGEGGRVAGEDPDDLTQVDTMSFDQMKELSKAADIVITHGGTGSLITALREGCHVIALPRRFALKEHYDDHQEQIVTAFAQRGLLQEADDAGSIAQAIRNTADRKPVMATSDPQELIAWLSDYFDRLEASL